MPRFKIGDKVRVRRDAEHVPLNILEKRGTVLLVIMESASQDWPTEWKPAYVVQLASEERWTLVLMREVWLEAA